LENFGKFPKFPEIFPKFFLRKTTEKHQITAVKSRFDKVKNFRNFRDFPGGFPGDFRGIFGGFWTIFDHFFNNFSLVAHLITAVNLSFCRVKPPEISNFLHFVKNFAKIFQNFQNFFFSKILSKFSKISGFLMSPEISRRHPEDILYVQAIIQPVNCIFW
jgi:hypothetical protein